MPGFCESSTIEEIAEHRYALVPGRYTGAEELVLEDEHFEEKLRVLAESLNMQLKEAEQLNKQIRENLKELLG